MSASQKNIWNLEKAYKGTPMNNICETFHIRGTFNVACLQECLNLVAESDPALRTRIITDAQGEPWQYEVPWQRIQFPVLDFSATNQEGILHLGEKCGQRGHAINRQSPISVCYCKDRRT